MTATVTPIRRDDWKKRLVTKQTRRGDDELVDCKANAVTILRNDPRWVGVLAWNELSQGIVCRRPAPWAPDEMPTDNDPSRPWTDTDGDRVQNWLIRTWNLNVSEQGAYRAALMVAEANRFDPLREMVLGFRWDGVPRIAPERGPGWLSKYFGVEDTLYSRLVGRMVLVGAVARALEPGCKFDTMLILEGPQGLFKSQGVERLVGLEHFRETPIDLRSNDRFLAVRGCWCREWPELEGLDKSSVTRVRSFLSSRWDDFRAPYGRGMQRAPRRCFFVGTTNPPQFGYLVDEEGNRRMLPVECGKVGPIELDAISRDRENLWAEGRTMYQQGVKWWAATPAERRLCNAETEARMMMEVWLGKVSLWLNDATRRKPGTTVTVREILSECLSVPLERHDRGNATRVGICLQRCGWVVEGRAGKGDRERYYVRRVEQPETPNRGPEDDAVEAEERLAMRGILGQ